MNTIWKLCLMTVMALAFVQVWAVEAVDPEDEAARQVDETMRQVNQARSTWNVERAFCFRVVDATGKPVPEVPVFFMASEFVNGAALWQNLNKKRIFSLCSPALGRACVHASNHEQRSLHLRHGWSHLPR